MVAQLDTWTDLSSRLQAALDAGGHSKAKILAITIPAPLARPAQVFEMEGQQPAYYFAVGDEFGDVGLGSAYTLTPDTSPSLENAEIEAQQVLEHAFELGIDAAAQAPRFYGGITYDQAPAPGSHWASFPRFRFDVPRFRYVTDGKRATLTLHVLGGELEHPATRRGWVAQTEAMLGQLARHRPLLTLPRIRARYDQPTASEWMASVERALTAMRKGPLEKVVLAREVTLEFESVPSVARVLENLNTLSPETTRFAFRRESGVFLGATPERLVLRLGSELRTEAVAGSIRALDADAAMQLMRSDKERHEHDLVVRELVRKLTMLGAKPEVPNHPSIRQLRHVLHLATPITARLVGSPHVLTLVSRLHPTPAVGGVPDVVALDLMREQEGFERGWYAAPIGWFDGQGDGEFVVGLRSGLLTGSQLRLYAGAGIVRDSQAETELKETELKLQSLLEAIGGSSESSAARETNSAVTRLDVP